MYQRSAAQVEEVSNIPIVRPAIAPAHIDSKLVLLYTFQHCTHDM